MFFFVGLVCFVMIYGVEVLLKFEKMEKYNNTIFFCIVDFYGLII